MTRRVSTISAPEPRAPASRRPSRRPGPPPRSAWPRPPPVRSDGAGLTRGALAECARHDPAPVRRPHGPSTLTLDETCSPPREMRLSSCGSNDSAARSLGIVHWVRSSTELACVASPGKSGQQDRGLDEATIRNARMLQGTQTIRSYEGVVVVDWGARACVTSSSRGAGGYAILRSFRW